MMRTGSLPRHPQDATAASHWPKRRPADGKIDWSCSAVDLYHFIRGITRPFPGAFAHMAGETVYLWRVGVLEIPPDAEPGTILGPYVAHGPGPDAGVAIAATHGILIVRELQEVTRATKSGEALLTWAAEWKGRRFS